MTKIKPEKDYKFFIGICLGYFMGLIIGYGVVSNWFFVFFDSILLCLVMYLVWRFSE